MNLLPDIHRFFPSSDQQDVVVECRRCGTTLDKTAEFCPHCGTDSIAHFEIS